MHAIKLFAALPRSAAAALLLAATSAAAGTTGEVRIDTIGYDVASDVFVIHGSGFVGGGVRYERYVETGGSSWDGGFPAVVTTGMRAVADGERLVPYVEIKGVPAQVHSYSGELITVQAPAGLRDGEYTIYVEKQRRRDQSHHRYGGASDKTQWTMTAGAEHELP